MADIERLQRLLGGYALAGIRARLRKRYEQGREGGSVTLGRLNEDERAALNGVLGRRVASGASLRFAIEEMDKVLQAAGVAASLHEALELLDGPIEPRAAQRATTVLAWNDFLTSLGDVRLAAWLGQPRALSALKRASGGDAGCAAQICSDASRVLAVLPCQPTTRSHLAARILGDAHALDHGRTVATLVLASLRHARSDDPVDVEEESVRSQWARLGVMVNELARPALFLNLPGHEGEPGEPAYLSLRALLRETYRWAVAQQDIFVCENPNIVALAADALGTRCAPLICTDGMPAAAQQTLLTQLVTAGAQLHYHGDFDWPGLVIGNVVMNDFGAKPWRFKTPDYRKAVDSSKSSSRRLDSQGRDARWDAGLRTAMLSSGIAIDEEAVVMDLLQDLIEP